MRARPAIGLNALLAIVGAALLLSGASALIYEIVWLRLLKLVFGDTVFAVSTVLSAFMAGLGIGSYVFGRLIDRRPWSGFRYYAAMEIGIGIYALFVPALLDSLVPVGVWITEQYRTSFYTLGLLRFALSFALLLPPTILMGGTLPVVVRQFVRHASVVGRNAGRLYAVNTLGAAVGCLSAGFVLVGTLGVHGTTTLAATSNILAGLAVFAVSGLARDLPQGEDAEKSRAKARAERPFFASGLLRAIPWIYALSGFSALALEVVWVRMLAILTNMHVQSFTIMLAILLSGIAIGSAAYTRWLAGRINAVHWLIGLELSIGVWALVSVPLFRGNPPVLLPPHAPFPGFDVPAPRVAFTVIVPSLVLVLIPALAMGIIFPLLVDFYASSLDKIGRHFGKLYGANTFGGIMGSFAGGFILLPFLGIQASMTLLGTLSIAIAWLLLVLSPGLRFRAAAAALIAVVLLLVGALNAPSYDLPPVRGFEPPWRLIYYREGRSASTRVFENEQTGVRELFADSWSIASTDHWTMKIQTMLANLPLLLHRHPEQVLIIGFGTGTTSGAAMHHNVKVDAVELVVNQRDSARLFSHVNHDILDNRWRSKFTLHIDDGRNWLLTKRQTYDVISRDALLAKPSQDLFSREFFQLTRQRLKPAGVFCGFLPFDSEYTAKRILAAFHSVYPDGSLWYVAPNVLLTLGTDGRLGIDYQQMKARMSDPGVQHDLGTVNLGEPIDLLSTFLMAGDDLAQFVSGYDAATDEKPLGFLNTPDFGSPRDIKSLTNELVRHRTSIAPYLHDIAESQAEGKEVRDTVESRSAAMDHIIRGQLALMIFDDPEGARKELEQVIRVHDDWKEARFQYFLALVADAKRLLDGADAGKAMPLLEEAKDYAGDHAQNYVLLGSAHEKAGQRSVALEYFRKASNMLAAAGYPAIPLVQQALAESSR